jgi:hypothetical protein
MASKPTFEGPPLFSLSGKLPDDEDRDGPPNVGFLTIQPPDAAASPRIFY